MNIPGAERNLNFPKGGGGFILNVNYHKAKLISVLNAGDF